MKLKDFEFLTEGKNDKYIFKAIFLVGGPASGKSTFYRKRISNGGFKVINPDDIYEFKMKKESINLKKDSLSADEREKEQKIASSSFGLINKRMNVFINGRLPLVIDRTGSSFGKTLENKFILESLGYECFLIYVKTPNIEKAIERNNKRERSVSQDYLRISHQKVERNIPIFLEMFKNNVVIDDSDDEEETNIKIRKVMNWIGKPVTNKKAKEWIKEQK